MLPIFMPAVMGGTTKQKGYSQKNNNRKTILKKTLLGRFFMEKKDTY